MDGKLKILVTGATGRQGGAVARALLARGHSVRAFTRSPSSEAARELATAGVEIAVGHFEDPASVIAAATGVDTVFLMGNSWEAGPKAETEHGIAAVDALRKAGAGHVIYSSVASADQHTGIPHFDSKYLVEQRLAASGLPYTISAPVAFMENHVAPWAIGPLSEGDLKFALPPRRKLQEIAVADIGRFVSVLAERREAVFGRRVDIAGDELTGEEMATILSSATGRPIGYAEIPLSVQRQQNPEAAVMSEWFDRVGYSADIAGLRREFPEIGWHRFADWARAFDWTTLDQRQAAE